MKSITLLLLVFIFSLGLSGCSKDEVELGETQESLRDPGSKIGRAHV